MENQVKESEEEKNKQIVERAIKYGYRDGWSIFSAINEYVKTEEEKKEVWSKIYSATVIAGRLTDSFVSANMCGKKISKNDLETMLKEAIYLRDIGNILAICYILGKSLKKEEKIIIFKNLLCFDGYEIFINPFLKRIKPNKRKDFLESVLLSYLENFDGYEYKRIIELLSLIGRDLGESEKIAIFEMALKNKFVYTLFSGEKRIAEIGDLEIKYIIKELEIFVKEGDDSDRFRKAKISAEKLPEPLRSEWMLRIASAQKTDQALETLKIVKQGIDIEPTLLSILSKEKDRNKVFEIIKLFPSEKQSDLAESYFVKRLDSSDLFSLIREDRRIDLIEKTCEECLLSEKNTYNSPDFYVSADERNQLYFRIAARAINKQASATFKKAKGKIDQAYWEKSKNDLFKKLSKEELLFVLENI